MMVLHIIEPTLNSFTGHCHSLVETIAQAAQSAAPGPAAQVRIWAGVEAAKFWRSAGQIEPCFYRRIRKLQSFFLYKRLLQAPGKLLLSTAGTSDFVLLDWAAKGQIPTGKVYLYVHWLGAKTVKTDILSRIAYKQPNLVVLCTTESTTSFFESLGFKARTVAYPHSVAAATCGGALPAFRHLLFAGAARLDKGFDRMADLVVDLARAHATWPVAVQTSTTHHTKHSPEIQSQIERLQRSNYPHLSLLNETLTPQAYHALFSGAISVQPYSRKDFADRVSGVTLDALSAGCPVIVTADTWLAQRVLQYDAGVAVSDLSPTGLCQAVTKILLDYSGYAQRAVLAGRAIQYAHSAGPMMQAIFHQGKS